MFENAGVPGGEFNMSFGKLQSWEVEHCSPWRAYHLHHISVCSYDLTITVKQVIATRDVSDTLE